MTEHFRECQVHWSIKTQEGHRITQVTLTNPQS